MKVVIGIVLITLVLLALIAYLVLMLNAREMIFCGDVKNEGGTSASVTRVYTTDLSANETLSEIIVKMNESETETLAISELTEVLAQYQNIIYAPVFNVSVSQVDSSTYIIDGSVYNGLTEDGEAAETDYRYHNMQLNAVVNNGRIIAAQNVYEEDEQQEEEESKVFTERQRVIEPLVTGADSEAAFALQDRSSFRVIVNGSEFREMPSVTFVFVYNVDALNPLDFTSISNDSLAINMQISFDENGNLAPTYELIKTITAEEE
ncbi:MAG: hypothetical protein J6A19_11445 [Oscillospiraceae bacterium]|nr:hypothetical protein [Oscillospiraceae bacterium]